MYYLYILRCADDSLSIGSAQDLDARVRAHNEGRSAAYTFKHRPVCLVYSEAFGSEDAALTRERQLKRWTAGRKKRLSRRSRGLKGFSKLCL
jgi:predicted GIY-YIG superfamily endonuclease